MADQDITVTQEQADGSLKSVLLQKARLILDFGFDGTSFQHIRCAHGVVYSPPVDQYL